MSLVRNIAAAIFRGHKTFVVDGVRYRERSTEPLHRALSERGQGYKDYDALFADSAPVRIRCTPRRLYADIVGPHLLDPYRLADPIVRPGMRVLDARCSTGFGAAALAARVGPSGAVVALDPDHESIRYARRRYTDSNIAWEIGGIGSLEGELDGSFDVVIAANAIRKGGDAPALVAALWRVLAPGGPMLLVQPPPISGSPANAEPEQGTPAEAGAAPVRLTTAELRNTLLDLDPEPGIEPTDTIELAAVIARKPQAPDPAPAR